MSLLDALDLRHGSRSGAYEGWFSASVHLSGNHRMVPDVTYEKGQRIHIPGKGLPKWVIVYACLETPTGHTIFVESQDGVYTPIELIDDEYATVQTLDPDGGADSGRVLAGMWTQWMAAAGANAETTVLASTPLRPYAHQSNAVYGAMLPQPRLRFLLADEPGTGKTIMAGLYLREMQKLGFVNRALVVCPAGLVTKWQGDFERFFGGELRRITNETIQQHGLSDPHDMWVVSLELAAMNPAVARALFRRTPKVWVHLSAHQNAQVVEMPTSACDLRSYSVLSASVIGRHPTHFFLVP